MNEVNKKVTIAGIGTFLPGTPINNQQIAEVFHVNEEWIEFFIGNKTRHLAIDLNTRKVMYSLADICSYAAKAAIENSGYSANQIEFVVMATATPDNLMPATVNLVAEKLGINYIPTYQLQSGCAGAIQALDVAQQFLLSGSYKTGLVIGGDICNKYIDMNRDFSKMSSSELVNYVLFGDGAGAVVLTRESQAEGLVIENIFNQLTGLNKEPGQVINWFGGAIQDDNLTQAVKEDYKAIEKNVPTMAKEILHHLMDEMQWSMDSVDFIMPPQLSGNMTQRIIKLMEFPEEKAVNCVAETGNNGNALPFLQLQRLDNLMQDGQRAFGVAVESSKWIKSGLALSKACSK
jgi:3-oxoacyl-[acyl-carrier-protein] synthase III